MKNWWLELYTFPILKKMLRAYGIVLVFTLFMANYLRDGLMFSIFACFYMAYMAKKNQKNYFAANVEFHKTHIPLKELRKAYLMDAIILFGVQMFCYLSIFYFIISATDLTDGITTMLYLGMFACSSLYPIFGIVGFKKSTRPTYMMLDDKYKIFNLFILSLYVAMGFIICLMMFNLKFSFITPLTFIFSSIVCAYSYFAFTSVFHLKRRKGTPKDFMKYSMVGMACSFIFCVLLAVGTRPVVHMTGVNPEIRYLAFAFSGPLAVELEPEEARTFLAVMQADYKLVLSKVPGVEQIPVSELIPKPEYDSYTKYVMAIDPSKENMIYILEHLSNKEPIRIDMVTAQVIMKKWPKTEEFPRHLISKYLKKEDLPKSDRIPATIQQEE